MARAAHTTHPIEALSEAIRSLEAAALVCLASAKKKPVHQLRTWTRRVEAQLELIALLPDAPSAPKQRAKAMRLLKKLRRAAGSVRDMDVERSLLAQESRRVRGSSQEAVKLRDDIASLRRHCGKQREKSAKRLASLLNEEEKKLPPIFAKLVEAFEPAEDAEITEQRLIVLVREWYANCGAFSGTTQSVEALHGVRKRAKLGRYMAESAPASARRARVMAGRFEALQQAGGDWHDLLQLRKTAAKRIGQSSVLVRRLQMQSERALRTYRKRLDKSGLH